MVMGYILRERKEKLLLNANEVLYFTQLLLELYATTENGSLLRHTYVLSKDHVESEIEKVRSYYKPSALSENSKEKMKALLVDIFPDYPEVSVTALGCEKKIISDYVERMKYLPSGIEKKGFKILVGRGDGGYAKPYGALDCFNGERVGVGCFIVHSREDNLRAFLPGDGIDEKYALSIIRLIVAHEIGHIVCHYKYGNADNHYINKRNRTPEMEREAAYFARLLLEHREFLYYGKNDITFTNACEEWENLFRYVHGTHGKRNKEWLDWVFE
jgi:hypothetical protein